MTNVHYTESVVNSPDEDILSGLVALATDNPYVVLTVESIGPEDGLTEEQSKQAGGIKVVLRIGNGIKDKETVRMVLTRALSAIPE